MVRWTRMASTYNDLYLDTRAILRKAGVEMAQLGNFLSKRRLRAFVSQKLFFFAFPAGLLTYQVRSRAYEAA